MAYGSREHGLPDELDKGHEGGACNRSSCQKRPALYYNHGSYSWYCIECRNQIYDAVGRLYWHKDFPNAGHEMFETREEMDNRKKKA